MPVGQAGARRLSSGGRAKQLAGALTAPLRRPGLHVHIGSSLQLTDRVPEATEQARRAVTAAWRTAALSLGEPVSEWCAPGPRGPRPPRRRPCR